ncbi:hypothetical protein MSG28_008898 [Choristoneura fumiferana]|uniref:Uncharacterized protein n=2 Tax=Choristoneura fumiferana TaxID=7141 RepID=A0ACC0J8G1_CHOFU|nr:hypothetical protein MSG28_008898 [Choristoneura fumiferana]
MEEFVSRSIANFGAKLFNEANSMEPTVCSPLSVEMVMAMLALGCKEKSNAEILRTLGIPDDDVLLASFAYIKSTLKSIRGATLNVANKIYIKNCAELKPGVKKDYEEIFESSIEHIDFSVQGAAANAIKNWFREQTNSNTSLGAVLDDNTRLVLVNAIYFQGVWEKPFDTRLYTYSLFHTSRNTTTEVFLMKIPKTWFKYGVSLELNARLNFEGGEASMVIVLPDEAVGLDAMIQKLDSGHNIMADIETLRNTELEVMMPRFDEQTTSHLNLVSLLLKAKIMLALLALGCKNQSHDELLKALDMTDDDAIRSSYGFLTSTLKSVQDAALNVANKERKPDDKYANNIFQFSLDQLDFIGNESAAANINNWVLNVANKVYLKKGGELKPDIEKDARNVFQSSLDQLDFIEKEAAAATINNWVAQQTNNKIKDIVSPDMMSEDTRVVLVNAIYFQGLWVKPFYASATKNRSFRVNERTTIQVPMMSLTETYFDYGVSKELKAKLLRMKYQGGQASMVIVLPDEVEGLKSVLQKLASGHNIMTDIESMRSTDLDIVIPKFKVETTIDLKKLLPNNADIDMLKSNEKLFVSDAIQKALIIVDENGTKAAACTAFDIKFMCARYPRRFDANRPFLYLLTAHQIPLFIGVYQGSEYA